MSIKIEIAYDKCIGAGQCVIEAPEVFDQDDDGIVVLLDEKAESHVTAVRSAAHACPARAIVVVTDEA
jgi:ferredoxin